jgi:hypothetical protein
MVRGARYQLRPLGQGNGANRSLDIFLAGRHLFAIEASAFA